MNRNPYIELRQHQRAQQARRTALYKACIEFVQGLIIALAFFGFALIVGLLF